MFTSEVLFELDVTIALRGQIVAPFDASVVAVKDGCSDRSIGDEENRSQPGARSCFIY